MHKRIIRTSSLLALMLSGTYLAGCGDGSVHGAAGVEDHSQAQQIGTVLNVNGQYEDNKCIDPSLTTGAKRALGSTWSAAISATGGPQPVVVLHDSSCVLDLVSFDIKDSLNATQTAMPAAPLMLGGSYLASPVPFSYTDSGTGSLVEFNANAKLTPASFTADFSIDMYFSDSPSPRTGYMLTGQYATVVSSSIANGGIAVPSDMLNGVPVTYAKDNSNVVTAVSGDPSWTLGSVPGQMYVILAGTCPNTLAGLDTAYAGGTQVPAGTAPTSGSFGLAVGTDLSAPLHQCMIVANCSGSCAYQLFDVTFN